MKMKRMISLFFFLFALGNSWDGLFAGQEAEFQKIKKMDVKELTRATQVLMEKKYPGENWEKYNFPKYVYTNDAVQTGYKIAVKESPLLAKFPCYCFCEEMGHKNLAHCFFEKGVLGKFDEHASTCNICITEAMRGVLWKELGATDEEMLKAMKEAYEK